MSTTRASRGERQVIAFDTETRLISYPDEVNPKGVCITTCQKVGGKVVAGIYKFGDTSKALFKSWLTNPNVTLVGHNVAFDLHVLVRRWPELIPDVWTALKDNRIEDTQIREKLYMLSTEGLIKPGTSLADLVKKYHGIDVGGKAGEDAWRFRYQELEGTPLNEWPEEAVKYAKDDSMYTLLVYEDQERVRRDKGPGSMNTRGLQVAAAYSLRGMEIEGIRVDQKKVAELKTEYQARHFAAVEQLMLSGLIRENGTRDAKAIAELAEELGVTERTDTGRTKTDRKTLDALDTADPRYEALMEYSNTLKAVSTFIPQMEFERIHPAFNPMVNTLRTSCRSSNYYKYKGKEYGKKVIKRGHPTPSMNFQQIPRDADFRDCFLPEEGHVFLTLDYSNLELVCASQLYFNLFEESALRDVLNTGTNLHDVTGNLIYNTLEHKDLSREEFKQLLSEGDKRAKYCRQAAKFVNLGCPGGQSARTIHQLARSQGMDITLEDAELWRECARGKFPEFDKFFGNGERTGWMKSQRVYQGDFPYAVDAWGIYLARKSYTAFANAVSMQTPGALGVKRALVRLYHACQNPEAKSCLYGCSLKALVHDEFVLSVPAERHEECLQEMAGHMLEGMGSVVPDVRLGVEACVQDRWGKEANGHLAKQLEFHKNPRETLCTRKTDY